MHFIIFLYLLISSFGDADAERYLPFRGAAKGKPFKSAPPFPSLPAAIHYQDSADTWRKSLGTAKTGGALPSATYIPKIVPLTRVSILELMLASAVQYSSAPIKNDAQPLKAVDYYKFKFLRGRK